MLSDMRTKLGFGDPSGFQGQGPTGPWGFRGSRDFRGSQDFKGSQFILRGSRGFWGSPDLREPKGLKKSWYVLIFGSLRN